MNQATVQRRGSWLRLAGVGAVLALLICLAIAPQFAGTAGDSAPLAPHDPMSLWHEAGPARKRASAEKLLNELHAEQRLGPTTSARLDDSAARSALVEALIAGLDEAANPDVMAYVSPGQSMLRTAEILAVRNGWEK